MPPPPTPATPAQVLGAGFAAVARLRQARALHPRGLIFTGTLHLADARTGVPFLDRTAALPALARLSKATATPGWLPDVLGIAVRVPDADGPGRPLDLLLSTAGGRGLARYLPLPARRWSTSYSSIMRYDAGGRRSLVLGALEAPPASAATSLPSLAALRQVGRLVVRLRLEPGGSGRSGAAGGGVTPLGRLELTGPPREDDLELRFDHDNLVPGLRARGLLAVSSRAAYAGSRRASPNGG